MKPTLAVSGYRGIWGDTLTSEIAREFISAFAKFVNVRHGKTIVVGRDARPSGGELAELACEVLSKAGFDVINIGIIPTPTIPLVIRKWGLSGGVIITASHNPAEYNGIKFVTEKSLFTSEVEVEEIKKYLSENNPLLEVEDPGKIIERSDANELHINTILSHIDIDAIREKKFSVFIDTINSAGAMVAPKLLEELDCTTKIINGEMNGTFAHRPEPLPQNLIETEKLAKETKADVGFVQDPDADRLVVIDEHGTILSEELTLALAVKAVMLKSPGPIVVNCSTSSINTRIAREYGQETFLTKVGEANVVNGIIEHHAIIGGEGGGGVIYPTINNARDSHVGIGLVLELLAHENKPLSEIVASLPKTDMVKEKITFNGDLKTFYTKIESLFPEAKVSHPEGIRLDFENNGWILTRPSNTEPIVRIYGEGDDTSVVREMIEKIKALVL